MRFVNVFSIFTEKKQLDYNLTCGRESGGSPEVYFENFMFIYYCGFHHNGNIVTSTTESGCEVEISRSFLK
jgi:hypothetical protein